MLCDLRCRCHDASFAAAVCHCGGDAAAIKRAGATRTLGFTAHTAPRRAQAMGRRQLYNRKPNLIIMRGLPGSRRTGRAKKIISAYGRGVICSTNDYYRDKNGEMNYRHELKDIAHRWNQEKAEEAMQCGEDPVIINNTNVRLWEMKPYVIKALQYNYWVTFIEPDKEWHWDIDKLARNTKDKVPRVVIERMYDKYEECHHIYDVLRS